MNWYRFSENSIGIPENASSVFSMYPNPANDVVSIFIPGSAGKKKSFTLRSSNGMLVKRIDAADAEDSKRIFTGDLPKGLYIVEMEMEGRFYRNKLIIQ